MFRSSHIRLLLIVLVCLALTVASVQADIGPGTGGAVAILVGIGAVGALIGIVVYHMATNQKTIDGCVGSADNSMKLKDMDGKTYVLEGDAVSVKPGRHMKLKGKQSKDKSGTLRLSVRKVVKDFGACTPAPIQ